MKTDVLVVGGGPAGSTTAALLARAGLSVTLLEREHFPRYHIGESISPSCRAIMEFAGVADKVAERGYPVKRGVLLRWGAEKDWAVNWQEMFGEDIRSWQVDRADFDHVLLDHAADQGVEVVQGARVRSVHFEQDRAVSAEWTKDGADHTVRFEHLVDASGRAGVLSALQLKNRRQHDVFRNVAIWGYYRGGELLPNTPPGGINVISSDTGWYWVIPQRDDTYSVGFVTHQTQFKQRRQDSGSVTELFLDLVAESASVSELVQTGEFLGEVRVEQDYSYVADSFCGPNWYLAGDSACFLDPLLSTGVHLAMYSGLLAAASITAVRDGGATEAEASGFYETLYRNAYQRMFALVSGMYAKYQGRNHYFWLAQSLLGPRGAGQEHAFGAIVAGLSDLSDAATAGRVAPTLGLAEAVRIAHQRAQAGAAADGAPLAPMKMDPSDFYDAASGLCLVTEPRLGITRVRE